MHIESIIQLLLALALGPLLVGVVNRVKAWFAGRRGRPVLQLYFDLAKLLRKGAVYSETTSWIFRAGPVIGLTATVIALAFIPNGASPSLVSFSWDLVFVAYLLGVGRFMTVAAALDTGSAFEGMASSREVQWAALAEPALILALAALTRAVGGDGSISSTMSMLSSQGWSAHAPVVAPAAAALLIVLLAENSRVPFDDPNTHLELTMIHEAMVLDHSGPDLAFILYGASLKLWLFSMLLVGVVLPVFIGRWWADAALAIAATFGVALIIGVVESTMARLRLVRLPQLLIAASVLSVLAFVLHGK